MVDDDDGMAMIHGEYGETNEDERKTWQRGREGKGSHEWK